MTDLACPSCGAPVRFHSSLSVSAVCPYCQTLVVRKDADIEAMGKVAALPPDMTPFQIGSQAHGKTTITLVGRIRMAWADGFWNEWYFIGDDGRRGWLAEAQGTYAVSHELETPLAPQTSTALDRWAASHAQRQSLVGQVLTFDDRPYVLTDVKLADCVGCEGELPLISPRGRRSLSFDFMGEPDEFASVDISDGERRVFTGRYVEWKDLAATNLRSIEGWS